MSHFSVFVIGRNIEQQLQPYHEYECTGVADEYVQHVDITAEVQAEIDRSNLEEGLEYYGLEDCIIKDEQEAYAPGFHSRFAVVVDGKLVVAKDFTNPNKKWDWWTVGGRWSGYLKGKDGQQHDSLRKKDIDILGMQRESALEAAGEYLKAMNALKEVGAAPTWMSWDAVREAHGTDFETAREVYNGQPAVQALREAFPYTMGRDRFLTPAEAFVQDARDRGCCPYAVVKDGVWHEKGTMGWWGISVDEDASWPAKVAAMLESLDDEEWITVVDCHI